jgi:hypothetical protein
MRKLSLALLIIALAGASLPVWAKSRWYQVEVIVFRHADTEAVGGEEWPALRSLPDFRNSVELLIDLPDFSDEPPGERNNEVSIPGPIAFQSLPLSDLQMTGVFRRLRKLNAYDPVLHVGWRQPGFGSSRARSVYISDRPAVTVDTATDPGGVAFEAAPVVRRVEGTVRIRVGRLLYVDTDFVNYGEEAPVRITEQRKVKLKELHYFDHPLFGIIVRVIPYRIPDPADQASTAVDPESVAD